MSTRNLTLIVVLSFLYAGCSRTFAPSGWLPATDEYQVNVYGGWMTLVVLGNSTEEQEEYFEYKGEFLSSDSDNVYLLADSVYIVNKANIRSAILELTQKNTEAYAGWGAAFLLTPVINGRYSLFTGPLGIISGAAAASGEAARDRYASEHPDNMYWSIVQKFARFPQGLPEGIDLNKVKPKSYQISG